MFYLGEDEFQKLCARILPVAKQVKQVEGKPLQLTRTSKIELNTMTAEYGPLVAANERINKYFTKYCGSDCMSGGKDALKVKLSIAEAPAEVTANAQEGYCLKISADGVEITGFGERGVLYGVVTFIQLAVWDERGMVLPAMTVLDWPDNHIRGFKAESRYGSNVMEREDWLEMMERLVDKKINTLQIALYGCWVVQYDGRVSEYLYMPIPNHPEIKTPMVVKYYSPEEKRWIESEKLPPLFCDNLLDEIFRRGRDLGLQICPAWNSFGHNTLIPANIHEVSAKNEDGTPTLTGFCTSNQATYDLLFSIYDHIIDTYMKPYGMDMFSATLDEVHEGIAMNADDVFKKRSPWCSCPECRDKDKGDIFIEHVIKVVSYLKKKGMKSIIMACDMLLATRRQTLGWLGDRLMEAVDKAGLRDSLVIDWWAYFDLVEKMYFDNVHPELSLRSVNVPWNGYYNWSLLTNPMRCVQLNAEMNHRDGGEGMIFYATWDMSYDRIHDAGADYTWSYEKSGSVDDVTDRYVLRHFPTRAAEARHAFDLMDWATEERKDNMEEPLQRVVSNFNLLLYKLSYYFYSYVRENKPYPRNFPGEALALLLEARRDYERALYTIRGLSREAVDIFRSLARDAQCDCAMADRMAYECENYVCLVEDWIALLKMYDLTQQGKYRDIAPLAEARRDARLDLMAHCERAKEKYVCEALTMRNHSIFLVLFSDIANYIRTADDPKIDLMDLTGVVGDTYFWLR